MKGLLIKDFKLMSKQKGTFVIMMIITFAMAVAYDASFAVSYMTFFIGIFSLSTISYDEYDNGYSFLFTLPVTRQIYVYEKYLFSLLCSGTMWLFASFATACYQYVTLPNFAISDWLLLCVSYLLVLLCMISLFIPVQLKYGQEKVRVMILLMVGGCIAFGFLISQVIDLEKISGLINQLMSMPPLQLLGISLVLIILLCCISVIFSIRIMQKKEF